MSEQLKQTSHTRPPRTIRKPHKSRRRILLIVLVGSCVGIALLAALPTTRWAEGTGYVITDQEVEIRPSVEGAIQQWFVQDGQKVQKGQLLIQLNNSVQQAACDQSAKHLKALQAQLEHLISTNEFDESKRTEQSYQAKRQLDFAKDRLNKMLKAANGTFSRHEIQEARLKVDLASSKLAELELSRKEIMDKRISVLKEQIQAAEKEVALYKAQLDQRRICSALNGTVYLNRFEPGEVVKPEHVLGQVFDCSSWIVKLKLPERYITRIRKDQNVRVRLAAYSWWQHGHLKAEVARVLPVVTPQATGDGVFYVEAVIKPDHNLRLHPGMVATARVNTGQTTWLMRLLGF